VTQVRNPAKNWLRQNGRILFPFLAFAIPFMLRVIPEILMDPYLTGFDTAGYYLPNTLNWMSNSGNFWAFMADAPLMYIAVLGVISTGVPIVFSFKVLAPLLLGLLGFVIYFYANKTLLWSSKKSLLVVLFATLYFVALRVSWDMLRSEFGLVFLFAALIFLKSGRSLRNSILLFVFMVMIVFSNQLVAVIMFGIVFATVLRFYIDKKKFELRRLIICTAVVAFLFLLTVYAMSSISNFSLIGGIPSKASGEDMALLGFTSYSDLVFSSASFLVFCYLPLLPLLIIGLRYFKSNIQLKAWAGLIFLILLIIIIIPNISLAVYPYRWILLLTYPLAFYAVDVFSHVKRNLYRICLGLGMGLILATLSVSFIALPNNQALSYYSAFPAYVPKSMLQNTVQLSDCQDTTNALQWAKNNVPSNGSLLVHDVFRGWATLALNTNQLYHYVFDDPETVAQELTKTSSSTSLYLIWWINGTGWYGQSTVAASFKEIYHSGNIAIYHYEP
jgi:hypothetical protein